jgi:hypothetical protein
MNRCAAKTLEIPGCFRFVCEQVTQVDAACKAVTGIASERRALIYVQQNGRV